MKLQHAKELDVVPSVKKMLVITKVRDPKHVMSLQKQINNNFENKDLFLKTNARFVINKFPRSVNCSSNKYIPFSSTNSSINLRNNNHNIHTNISHNVNAHHNQTNQSLGSPRRSYHIATSSSSVNVNMNGSEATTSYRKRKLDFKLVDEQVMKSHFNELKTLEKQNKSATNEMLFVNLPREIKRHLLVQERKLFTKHAEDSRLTRMSKHLCKRTRKKVKDLLIHQLDSYQFKRQAQNVVDKDKNSYGRVSSENKWLHSLRQNECNSVNDIMNKYVNIRTQSNPLWIVNGASHSKYRSFGDDEMKRKPKMISNDCYNNYIRRTIMSNEVSRNSNMKRLHCLTHLEVKGTNLLTLESESEQTFKGKRILYTKGQLDTLNIKATNQFDFDKEYTNMIKNKLIIQNY